MTNQIVIFRGVDITIDLIRGKFLICLLNGCYLSVILYSYVIIFFDVNLAGNYFYIFMNLIN